jgi:hypothetical protein
VWRHREIRPCGPSMTSTGRAIRGCQRRIFGLSKTPEIISIHPNPHQPPAARSQSSSILLLINLRPHHSSVLSISGLLNLRSNQSPSSPISIVINLRPRQSPSAPVSVLADFHAHQFAVCLLQTPSMMLSWASCFLKCPWGGASFVELQAGAAPLECRQFSPAIASPAAFSPGRPSGRRRCPVDM